MHLILEREVGTLKENMKMISCLAISFVCKKIHDIKKSIATYMTLTYAQKRNLVRQKIDKLKK